MPTRPTIVPTPRAERRRAAKTVAKAIERSLPAASPPVDPPAPQPAATEPTTEQRLYAALQQQANEIADWERQFGRVSRERDQLRMLAQQQAQQLAAAKAGA